MECPNCGCPFVTRSGFRSADAFQAWKDTDGTWYRGPAVDETISICDGCGRKTVERKERGKLVSKVISIGSTSKWPIDSRLKTCILD